MSAIPSQLSDPCAREAAKSASDTGCMVYLRWSWLRVQASLSQDRLKQFHRISRGIVDDDLFAPDAGNDLVSKVDAALGLEQRDEGWQRRVHSRPRVRGRSSGRARVRGGDLVEGGAAGLAESCALADLVTASCADHGRQTTTAWEAYGRATGRSSLSGALYHHFA